MGAAAARPQASQLPGAALSVRRDEEAALALWEPTPGPERESYERALAALADCGDLDRLLAALRGEHQSARAAAALLRRPPLVLGSPPLSLPPRQASTSRLAEDHVLDAAVFVALRAAALARMGHCASPAAFLRSSFARFEVTPVPPVVPHGLFDADEADVEAAIELGRFRRRVDEAAVASGYMEVISGPVAPVLPLPKSIRVDQLGLRLSRRSSLPVASPWSGTSTPLTPHQSATAPGINARLGRIDIVEAIRRSERDFRDLAGDEDRLNKVAPEAFLQRYLKPATLARWRDLSLVWEMSDLDYDGYLDGVEFAAAVCVMDAFEHPDGEGLDGIQSPTAEASPPGSLAAYFGRRLVLPSALVHHTKRAMAIKREASVLRVRRVVLCSRASAGDVLAEQMQARIGRMLAAREYDEVMEITGNAVRTAARVARADAIVVLMTANCLDACCVADDAFFAALRAAIEGNKVIVPVFHEGYFAPELKADYLRVPLQREKLRGFPLVDETMLRVMTSKGVTLEAAHAEAVARSLHNLLQGRELSLEDA